MKYYLLIFLLLGSLFLSGQVSDISIAEKTAFSKILLANKTKVINTDSMVIKALLDSGMSDERYAEILKSAFNGEKIALTDKDPSATTMVNPWGVCVSPDGKLLVADSANDRVLIWNSIPTTNGAAADVVIGQTIMGTSGAGTTSTNLNAPIGLTVSPSGKVAIGEFGNSRVLVYNSIPTSNGAAANVVLGQPNFTSSTACYPSGSPTNNNMFSIYNASFDLYGRLYVAGREMNRVLVFGAAPSVQANLGIGITSNMSTACLGTSYTITITISNATATAASGVIATASLPAGFTYSSHTASTGTYNPSSGYWNVGSVPASGSRTLTINGTKSRWLRLVFSRSSMDTSKMSDKRMSPSMLTCVCPRS